MPDRDKPHLQVRAPARRADYRPPPRRVDPPPLPAPADRRQHGLRLTAELEEADTTVRRRRHERATPVDTVEGAVEGLYLSFDSFPGLSLALEALDPRQGGRHPELMSVHTVEVGAEQPPIERATVFVPEGTLGYFLTRMTDYVATADMAAPRRRHLVEHIATVHAASIEALWTDPADQFPPSGRLVWWEVWLRRRDGRELSRLHAFAAATGVRVGSHSLGFGDRTVVLMQATAEQLAGAVDVLDDLAELRRPFEPTHFLAGHDPAEQAQWVRELAQRVQPAGTDAPVVCVVDTGVYRDHPLLAASLQPQDCHAADPRWPVHDDRGHGTQMAGLALYGDLGAAFTTSGPLRLRHRLESVKLFPPAGAADTDPELYGALTADATSRVEIPAPTRPRVYSLAMTAAHPKAAPDASTPSRFGQPTSWSATLDALAAGRSVTNEADGLVFLDEAQDAARRLFVLSAGNIARQSWEQDHLARSDLEPVEDPAQAWNALTVGAFTELDTMAAAPPEFAGWTPLAARGELSPFSRTSVVFNRAWPVKPDIVLEGGNLARSPDGTDLDTPDNLQLLTTRAPVLAPLTSTRLLTTTNATSAATAQAAALAARIAADYPQLWPETVRALIVHSAEWTPAMHTQFAAAAGRKRQRVALLRRYGMGVPDLTRATRSATDALTLIAQDVIHPFAHGAMREIHLHELPWPTDVLADLGAAQVRLRITLSYFVEPNPGRRGWRSRYNYASHGLRFDVRRATESTADFEKRVNQKALAEDEHRPASTSETGDWFFGVDHQRAPGSLHSDIWEGNAIDLAQRGALAVFPVTGWWKENRRRDRSDAGARYALIVSIETPGQDVDIWTPVAQQIGIPTTVAITT